jgi:hypothetical protein
LTIINNSNFENVNNCLRAIRIFASASEELVQLVHVYVSVDFLLHHGTSSLGLCIVKIVLFSGWITNFFTLVVGDNFEIKLGSWGHNGCGYRNVFFDGLSRDLKTHASSFGRTVYHLLLPINLDISVPG